MFCPNCGKEVASDAKFCDGCGSRITTNAPNQKSELEPDYSNHTKNNVILARSESCLTRLEEWYKHQNKTIMTSSTIFSTSMALLIFGPPLYAKLVDDYDFEMPLPIIFILSILLVIAGIITVKQSKTIKEEYDDILAYCRVEALAVDNEKIFGSTTRGEMTLLFSQIKSVTCKTRDMLTKSPLFLQENLHIKDVSGNIFIFHSFNNSKELKLVIESRLSNQGV